MKKNHLALGMLFLSIASQAQTAYESEKISSLDLTGTARYVGMGGAMNALGADMSVAGTNPAGLALYRRGDVSLGAGLLSGAEQDKFAHHSGTQVLFNHLGIVQSYKLDDGDGLRSVVVGLQYQRVKDFNRNLFMGGSTNGTTQLGQFAYQAAGNLVTPGSSAAESAGLTWQDTDGQWYYDNSSEASGSTYQSNSKQWGGISQYNVNLAANISDRVYLGVNVGLNDLNYHSYKEYTEYMPNGTENYTTATERRITGIGVNVGFGIVVRPVEDSPFRFGLSVVTPTYYESLKARTTHELYCDGGVYFDDYAQSARLDTYEFNLKTPWRFNLSLGHTFNNILAIGAEYEYADYSTNKVSYGDSWDGYDDSDPDDALNWNTEDVLKGVHTLKLGAELTVLPEMKVRVGYNHVTASTYKDAYLNTDTRSELYRYCYPETDFTNLSAINRFTCGIGFAFDKMYLDMAYQYQHQTGKFYAYDDQYASAGSKYISYLSPQKADLSKHTFQVTLGYRF
jgi:hypothetical protein